VTKPLRIHVSSTARGKADGSAAKPFASLEAARDALRTLRRRGMIKSAVRVLIAPGVYRLAAPLVFTSEDGGTTKHPVTWSGDGGRPLLSGARAITGWQEGTINGRSCWTAQLPEVAAGRWWFTQLFVNGRRRLRARLPKRGFQHFAGVPEDEAKLDQGGMFHGAMSSRFIPGEMRAFRNPDDIDVVVPDHWYENHLRLASVDEDAHVVRFATKGYSRFSRDETGRHTRYRLDHVAEGCSDPGDWWLDRGTGTLHYIPMQGEDRATTLIEAPALDRLLDVQGNALDAQQRVHHLRFEFLDLRHADWELPRENPGALQSAFQVPAAVRFVGAEDCALYACRVSQVSGWAVEVLRGCQRNRIVACALHDLGGGGVKVGHEGGLPKGWVDGNHGAFRGMDPVVYGWGPCIEDAGGLKPGRDQAEPSATTISDCSIHDGGIIFHSAIGVWIGDASKNRVVHNHIWNFNYSGISCGWNWGFMPAFTCDNRIEGNHIHGIGHGVLSDMGAIYTLGRQAGTTISRNWIHDVHSYGYGGWGIYPDEGSSWMRIEDNVVCGTKCGGFHQHYGRDNLVRGNLFADAVENQVQVGRREIVRSVVFTGNVVQGAGSGALWQGAGWASARIDGNVYAGDPGRPALFGGRNWEQWRTAGHDRNGRLAEAALLDAGGAAIATGIPNALKAAGVVPRRLAQVVAQAGPRQRETLPPTIDAVPPEAEPRRAIVEVNFWPWPAEWPPVSGTPHPWSKLPSTVAVSANEAQAVSLTLENRGDAATRGSYRLRVVPASAARINGANVLRVALKPGGKAELDTTVVATGKERSFRIEAVADGPGLVDSCLHFSVLRSLDLSRCADLGGLVKVPALPVDGNGRPVQAAVRFALADERLLLRVSTHDAKPVRGGNLWDGSSVELFAASERGSKAAQLILAPAIGDAAATARLMPSGSPTATTGVDLTSSMTTSGWELTASVPLTLLDLDAGAANWVLDLVVNATAPGAQAQVRTHLAGEDNPFGNSNGYVLMRPVTDV
jgi:hypothetical protein